MKKNKGITLIALVITIIVMLILVGVTISMAINGGLFSKAGEAAGTVNNALIEEGQLSSSGIEINGNWYESIDDYIKESSSNENVEPIEIIITGDSSVHVRDTITLAVQSNQGTILEEYEVVWTSSNEEVASVNNGVVSGGSLLETMEETEVTITAKLKKDNNIVATATKGITVKPIECGCEYGFIIDREINPETPMCYNCFSSENISSNDIDLVQCLDCGKVLAFSLWAHFQGYLHEDCVVEYPDNFETVYENVGVEYYCEGRDCRGEFEPLYLGCEEYFEECPDCIYGMIYE